MSEERFNQLETTVTENSQDIRGIYVALREITETMKAFASGIVELREQDARLSQKIQELTQRQDAVVASQESLIVAQRTLFDSVERLNNTVEAMATQAAEDRQAWQAEIRQIWEYLRKPSQQRQQNS